MDIGDLIAMAAGATTETSVALPVDLAATFRADVIEWVDGTGGDDSGRYKDYLRSSELSEVCGRREALYAFEPGMRTGPKKTEVGRQFTFDAGSMIHWWWQNYYLGPMGRLWGRWGCARCGRATRGLMPERCECGAARRDWVEYEDDNGETHRAITDVITYVELAVRDDVLRYGGHPDGLLVDPPQPLPELLVELKSCSNSTYNKITKGPDPDHVIQVHSYMRLLGVDRALIIYINKGKQCDWSWKGGKLQPGAPCIKVFLLEFDPAIWAEVEQRIRDHWRARETPPATREEAALYPRVCDGPSCTRAKDCPMREPCFSWTAP